ncbi:MAG: hypothetical protein PVF74_15145 [Anaerolineales bacterium]
MLTYAISVMVEEAIRDVQYAQVAPDKINLLSIPKVETFSLVFVFGSFFVAQTALPFAHSGFETHRHCHFIYLS